MPGAPWAHHTSGHARPPKRERVEGETSGQPSTLLGHAALQCIKKRSLQSDQGPWHLPAEATSAPTVEISRRSSQGIMKSKAYKRRLSSAAEVMAADPTAARVARRRAGFGTTLRTPTPRQCASCAAPGLKHGVPVQATGWACEVRWVEFGSLPTHPTSAWCGLRGRGAQRSAGHVHRGHSRGSVHCQPRNLRSNVAPRPLAPSQLLKSCLAHITYPARAWPSASAGWWAEGEGWCL